MSIPLAITTPACALSTLILRGAAYIFLRWIPSHIFIKPVFTSYLIWLTTFLTSYYLTPKWDILSKELEFRRVDTVVPDESPAETPTENANGATEATPLLEHEKTKTVPAIEATETVIKRKKHSKPLKSLLLGTPEPNSKFLNLTNLLLHTLLALFVADLIYRSEYFYPSTDLSFARTGHVSENTARILVREPDESNWPIYVYHRPEPEEDSSGVEYPWIQSPAVKKLSPVMDYSIPFELHDLHPNTRYRYRTSNNHTGTFYTAPAHITSLDRALGHNARKTKFTFLTSSCIKARTPYSPFDHPLHIRGLKILGQMLKDKIIVPNFMLFLGDFIYIDVPNRPRVSEKKSIVEGYREHYRQVYASPDWPSVSIPWMHVIDDHEIANDWSSNNTGIYPYAMDPFYIYQHSINPPSVRKGVTYYHFTHGTASFFLLDTRRYRSDNFSPDGSNKSMLGSQQLHDVLAWLRKDEPGIQWKILVTSVPFTKNWRFGSEDTWGGFLHERRLLLEEMWKVGAEGRGGVIILSGDRHEFGATAFPPPPDSPSYHHRIPATVHEFSCSPLSQFYLPKRTYVQTDDEDILIKYVPDGNSKFGAVEVDSTNPAGEQAVLKYRLFVDGKEVWDWVVTADMSRRRIRGGVEGEGEKEGGKGLWE